MTFDPTTNRIPFVLLTWEEQDTLKAWPHGWEYFSRWSSTWDLCISPEWSSGAVYRGLPKPVVTSAWWNIDSNGGRTSCYYSRKDANTNASSLRISVLRIDTCNGVSTAHLEGV